MPKHNRIRNELESGSNRARIGPTGGNRAHPLKNNSKTLWNAWVLGRNCQKFAQNLNISCQNAIGYKTSSNRARIVGETSPQGETGRIH